MPVDQPNHREFERIVTPSPEVLDTDSGRKPIWGIVAGIAFVAFALVVVWHVTSGDSAPPSYSSQSAATIDGDNRATTAAPAPATPAHRQSRTAATVFFFGLFGVMGLVGARIAWGARRLERAGT